MLDKEKDKRLSYLLDQTDVHLLHMGNLIRMHQEQESADFPEVPLPRFFLFCSSPELHLIMASFERFMGLS